jgi:hypothetical protein
MSKKKKKTLKAKTSKPVELTGTSLMAWGKWKGTKLDNLPDHYCRWLLEQDWIKDHAALYAYLLDNESLFNSDKFDFDCDASIVDLN